MKTLSNSFGDGWMTKSAQDLCKIMVAFGNVDPQLLVLVLAKIHSSPTTINTATVEKALKIMTAMHDERVGPYEG